MSHPRTLAALLVLGATVFLMAMAAPAFAACSPFRPCPEAGFDDGAATLELTGETAGLFVGSDVAVADYAWRLRTLCEISDETNGVCTPSDFRPCPAEPNQVVRYFVLEQRVLVRPDGTAADGLVPPPGTPAGTPVGDRKSVV